MTRFARLFLLASLVVGSMSLAAAPPASAQTDEDREAAREHFGAGVGRYEAGDYQGALDAFQEAYRLAPHPMVRVNMANCYEHLGRPIEAIHHFERFLAESEDAPRQQRREVESAMRRLRQQIAEVHLTIAPDGADVTIDGTETRRAPVHEAIVLTAGSHRFEVRMDGFRSSVEEIELEGGESRTLTIRLERGQDAPAVAATEVGEGDGADATGAEGVAEGDADQSAEAVAEAAVVPASDEGGWQLRITTPVIIGGSATAALGIGAIVTGVLALSSNDQFEDAVVRANDPAASPAEQSQARADGRAAADAANTLSIVTDVFVIGTIAAAAVTTFFVIVDGLDTEDTEDAEALASSFRLVAAPSASSDGGGLVLQGQF